MSFMFAYLLFGRSLTNKCFGKMNAWMCRWLTRAWTDRASGRLETARLRLIACRHRYRIEEVHLVWLPQIDLAHPVHFGRKQFLQAGPAIKHRRTLVPRHSHDLHGIIEINNQFRALRRIPAKSKLAPCVAFRLLYGVPVFE